MPRGNYTTPEELEQIKNLCLIKTDKEIAELLKKDVRTISSYRKKLGITKGAGGGVEKIDTNKVSIKDLEKSSRLTEDQKKEFFKEQLVNSLYYKNLKLQFEDEEIDFYLEEWSVLSLQFEDILSTEKRQIDEYIKAEIMGNRILRNVKIANGEIEKLQKETEELYNNKNMEDDENAQERDAQLMNLTRSLYAQSQVMSNDYQKNVDMRNKLLNELNARRKDRITQFKDSKTTFAGLVEVFRDREVRDTQGKYLELLRLAKSYKQDEWRKPITFADGTKDCILMDQNSILPVKEIILLSEQKSQFIDDFSKEKGKKILIIDDDSRRNLFFSLIFKQNDVKFASNVKKGREKLIADKYDLICLDYDLGLKSKGTELIDDILKNEETKIVIHSMNRDGSSKLFDSLKNNLQVEKVPFENIKNSFGEIDATESNDGRKDDSNNLD